MSPKRSKRSTRVPTETRDPLGGAGAVTVADPEAARAEAVELYGADFVAAAEAAFTASCTAWELRPTSPSGSGEPR